MGIERECKLMGKKNYDIIVVGTGPTGIFTVLELLKKDGNLDILMLEKGKDISERECPMKQNPGMGCINCDSCSVVSGWGGAGAYSDGKLSLSPKIGGHLEEYIGLDKLKELISYADDIYLNFGAPDRIFGVDGSKVEDLKFGTNVKDFIIEDSTIIGVKTADGTEYYSNYVITAPGRENASWLSTLAPQLGINTTINPVDIGVRVETSAVIAEQLTEDLYESKLIYQTPTFDDKVRTFCMSPYGEVVNENNQGLITVNGHSHADIKTENTNFALLVSKTFTEPFHEPITYGKNIAKLANLLGGGVLIQRLGDLLEGHRSTPERINRGIIEPTLKEATPGDLSLVFPYRHLKGLIEMLEALDNLAPGLYSRDTLLYGVEVKFYSNRIDVNNNLETKINNLYTAGDGAGITRGLMQASVSGIGIARNILDKE